MEISLEQRVENLERMFKALMSKTSNDKDSVDTDTQGLRDINFSQSTDIADNKAGIEQNSADIEYVAIMSDIDI